MTDFQNISFRDFSNEFVFITSRSSGPGGQNVNKVNSRVELRFNIPESKLLTEAEKHLLFLKLKTQINNSGILQIFSQTERSQFKNKQNTIEKFYFLIEKALTPVKRRKATKPTLTSKLKRIERKKQHSEKKMRRREFDL